MTAMSSSSTSGSSKRRTLYTSQWSGSRWTSSYQGEVVVVAVVNTAAATTAVVVNAAANTAVMVKDAVVVNAATAIVVVVLNATAAIVVVVVVNATAAIVDVVVISSAAAVLLFAIAFPLLVLHNFPACLARFYYSRFNGGFMYDKLVRRNVSWIRGVSKEEYTNKSIEDCVLKGDPECQLIDGRKYDLTIVRKFLLLVRIIAR